MMIDRATLHQRVTDGNARWIYRALEECINGTTTGTYHATLPQIARLATLDTSAKRTLHLLELLRDAGLITLTMEQNHNTEKHMTDDKVHIRLVTQEARAS